MRSKLRSNKIALCFLCAAAAFAQTPAGKTASVSGTVVNSVTGTPLPRVHVILGLDAEGDRTYGALTTSDGKFSITGLVPGSYAVTLDRIGFSMPTGPDAPDDLVLKPDDKKDDLRWKLEPVGAITGRVTNADGEPVEGVDVEVESAAGSSSDLGGTTDAKGRFRVGGLAPGRYRVKASPENPYTPAELRTDGTVDVEDAPTYYPGSSTFRQGARVAVTSGGETGGVDIQLARVPIVAVSGKVEGAPPGSVNAQLWIAQQGGNGRSAAGIKPDGTFRLWRLYPGKYEVSAMWQAPGGQHLESAAAEFEVAGSNIDKLSLRLIPLSNIAGHVEFQDEGAKPASNVPARLAVLNTGTRGGSTLVNVAADGSFQLTQLRAGRYRMIPSWGGVYVASMQLGLTSMDGSLLDLATGAAGAQLSVRVSAATATVSGNVDAGARVALVYDGEAGGIPARFVTAGAGGTYSFDSVAPGKYKLVAVQDADSDYLAESGRFDDYEDQMESIELHPGEKLSHDLKRR